VSTPSYPGEHYWRAHLELIDRGGVVLTATRRQARALARVYAARAGAAGRQAWDAPRVSALADWLAERWRQGSGDLALLDGAQSLYLWRAEVDGAGILLDSRAAARAAHAAYAVARDYELDWSRAPAVSHEQRSFRAWSTRFQARCRESARLDSADVVSALLDQPPEPTLRIGLHGFDRLSPALRRLLARWAEHGVEVLDLTPKTAAARLSRAAPESQESELEAIGQWCLERLTRDPGARLAVIVPDLAGREAAVERVLAEYIQPSVLRPGAGEGRLFRSARSPRLTSYAVIDAALGVLSLAEPRTTLEALGRLLRSPYLAGADIESHARARADARLRADGRWWIEPSTLPEQLARVAPCPRFADIVLAVRAELSGPARRGPAAWSAAVARALRAAGWPTGRPLGSGEFQTAEKFSELLSSLASLEAVVPALPLSSALDELAALAAGTEFQPDSGEPAVVVFDGLEELGYALDGLYVAGLSAERLPGPVAPEPFLPAGWQREQRLPHASAEIELERAQALLHSWSTCAEEIVFSCAVRDEDGVLAPSPLIARIPERESIARRPTRAAQIRAAARLTEWQDQSLPALAPGAPLPRGVRLLELQSICPFRASAELRLHAQPLTRRGSGIDALTRGQLLHAACAALWRELKDSATLAATGPEGRVAAVKRAVDVALSPSERRTPRGSFDSVERDVLTRRLLALLEFEGERAPFRVARAEWATEFVLAGRAFNVQIDRIDELADGRCVVIDYKSGQAAPPKRWTGSHPDRPQVAAYAAHLNPTPVAAAYLHLGADPPKFSGLAAAPGLLPEVKAPFQHRHRALKGRTWESVIGEWRTVTESLARAFAAGESAVEPTREACQYCQLEGLCRVPRPTPPGPEVELGEPDEPEEEGEDDES
jgi:probable DNA repair protein